MAEHDRGPLLVLDSATARLVLTIRHRPGGPTLDGSGPARSGSSALGLRLADLLADAGLTPAQLTAVGVGTGPGSFTGLRVGMATAKALAWSLGIPLAGLSTVDGLRRASATETGVEAASTAVIQAAGARDHYLTLPGSGSRLVAPGTDLAALVNGHPALALGVDRGRLAGVAGPGGLHPLDAGDVALAGLGVALLALLEERLASGPPDDPATSVPAYVALPRGSTTQPGGPEWVPDLR